MRRRLYEYVASRDEPAARDAAAGVGISRTLAAYHLDKLADAGILAVSYAWAPGWSGPGARRPAKRYSLAQQELSASVPPNNYGLRAKLLAEAVASDDSGTVGSTVAAVAHQAGQDSVSGTGVVDALCRCGYEPAQRADGDIELRNRRFRQLVRQYPELVCSLNLQLIHARSYRRPTCARGAGAARRRMLCRRVCAGAPRQKRVSRAAKTPPRPTRNTAP